MRARSRMSAKVRSAVSSRLAPGVLVIVMPRRMAQAKSMPSARAVARDEAQAGELLHGRGVKVAIPGARWRRSRGRARRSSPESGRPYGLTRNRAPCRLESLGTRLCQRCATSPHDATTSESDLRVSFPIMHTVRRVFYPSAAQPRRRRPASPDSGHKEMGAGRRHLPERHPAPQTARPGADRARPDYPMTAPVLAELTCRA